MDIFLSNSTPKQRKRLIIIFWVISLFVLVSSPLFGIILILVCGYWTYKVRKSSLVVVRNSLKGGQLNTQERGVGRERAVTHKNNVGLKTSFEADFKELLRIYKANKPDWELEVERLIQDKFPEARPNVCPYCSTTFDFTAKRARKCPDCGKKMVVRQGHFLSEEQVKDFEEASQKYYDKQSAVSDLERNLQHAQDDKLQKDTVDMNRYLAEAYRAAAKFANRKDDEGYSFWDKAWRYYNTARTEEMKHLDRDMLQYSKLPEMMFEMSQMIIDQSKFDSPNRKDKLLANALNCMFSALAESIKFGDEEPYFLTQLYQEAKKVIDEQKYSDERVQEIVGRVSGQYKLAGRQQNIFERSVRNVMNYELIRG